MVTLEHGFKETWVQVNMVTMENGYKGTCTREHGYKVTWLTCYQGTWVQG